MRDAVKLIRLSDQPLDLNEVYAAVGDPAAGAIAVFVGTVRDHDNGQGVDDLEYSAHPTAEAMLREVAAEVASHDEVIGLAAVHRVGRLTIGDIAVIVAVSSAHRVDAFAACRRLIDELKRRTPIWKHQDFSDGTEEWVGTP